MLENGAQKCSCVKTECKRHGKCMECMAHHEKNKRYKTPYCKKKKLNNKK